MARLSVNLNKIALLRNSRRTGVPDVLEFARLAHEAGRARASPFTRAPTSATSAAATSPRSPS